MDVSKASLAWLFTSTAASLCQTLGYHRVSQVRSESAGPRDIKTLLFWHVYMLDKTLSLRTGRASVIQDWDVTLPRRVDNTMVADPWGLIITTWIKQAEIQHRVYEQLFDSIISTIQNIKLTCVADTVRLLWASRKKSASRPCVAWKMNKRQSWPLRRTCGSRLSSASRPSTHPPSWIYTCEATN